MSISRRSFLHTASKSLLAAGCGLAARPAAAQTKRPNIVFIFADDLGWGDLGCYGQKRLKTPNLDRLARQGTMFTQFYVSGSVCSPSRTAIMTGHYPARHGVHGHFASQKINQRRGMPDYLDPNVTTLTDLFQQNGYKTGHFGKWHLGSWQGDPPTPEAYGIDQYRTTNHSNRGPVKDYNLWAPEKRPVASKLVLDEAIDFIKENKENPFYVNAWFVDPHATLNPSEQQMQPYSHMGPKGVPFRAAREVYYATVTEMDRQIGVFLDKLDALGLAENTIVIFSSDNGPEDIEIGNASHSGVGSTGPLRGRKRSIYEGGIRVPFIVRWPGKTPAGKIDQKSVIAGVDFIPTLCGLAGIAVPNNLNLDGENRAAAFKGQPRQRTQPLMWEWRYRIFGHVFHHSPMLAIRDKQWKLLMNPDRSRVELYDIVRDPREMTNLAEKHPNIVKKLSSQVLDWQKELPKSPCDPGVGMARYPWPE
ncbi:sulfatase-like hydrolase/transferase [bacterium]|nr:sulfatase-like hydrolase/transferase [bacterium]